VSNVSVECEITRLNSHLTTVDDDVCIHFQGHVYCAVHYISSERNRWS